MSPNEYQNLAMRTDRPADEYHKVNARYNSVEIARLNHACQGICDEAGEIMSALKKHIQYGRPLDWVNVKEEISDLLWYCALACEAAGTTMEQVMEVNIKKLEQRYPEKFTEHHATNRDLEAERKVLES